MQKQSGNIILIILFWFTGFTLVAQQNNNFYPNISTTQVYPQRWFTQYLKIPWVLCGLAPRMVFTGGMDMIIKSIRTIPTTVLPFREILINKIMMEDEEGNIWIGTQANGMNIYNPNTETFTHFSREPEFQFDFDFNWINTALFDKEGEIWLAAELSGGINNFDKSTGTITSYWLSTDDSTSWINRISSIYEDRTGRLWVGSYKGLHIFDKSSRTYFDPASIVDIPDELNNCVVSSIFEDQEGTIWIGTDIGLFRLNTFQNIVDHFKHNENDPNSIASNVVHEVYDNPNDGGKSLLILTRIGINKLDKSSGQVTRFNNHPNDPKYQVFNAMFDWLLDDNGILWAGSGFGAIRCNLNTNPFSEFQLGPFDQETFLYEAMTFLEDRQGNFWIGTDYSGLLKYDNNMNLLKRYNYDPNDPNGISYYMIFSLFEDVNGILWVGTAFHLDVLDQKNNRFLPCSFPSDVPYSFIRPNDFHEDKSGILWIATNSGLYYQQKQEILNTSFQLHPDFANSYVDIRTIVEDSNGNIWFGSSGWVVLINS